jgi:hypothetical protein
LLTTPNSQPAPLQLRLRTHHHLPTQPRRLLSKLPSPRALPLPLHLRRIRGPTTPHALSPSFSAAGGGDDGHDNNNNDDNSGGGGGGGDGGHGDGGAADGNRGEALFVLAQLGRKLESLPSDLAAAVDSGRVTGDIVRRFNDLEASALFRWMLQFRGFRERLLADDLFLAKLGMELGVGVIAKVCFSTPPFFLCVSITINMSSSYYCWYIRLQCVDLCNATSNFTPFEFVLFLSSDCRRVREEEG